MDIERDGLITLPDRMVSVHATCWLSRNADGTAWLCQPPDVNGAVTVSPL